MYLYFYLLYSYLIESSKTLKSTKHSVFKNDLFIDSSINKYEHKNIAMGKR